MNAHFFIFGWMWGTVSVFSSSSDALQSRFSADTWISIRYFFQKNMISTTRRWETPRLRRSKLCITESSALGAVSTAPSFVHSQTVPSPTKTTHKLHVLQSRESPKVESPAEEVSIVLLLQPPVHCLPYHYSTIISTFQPLPNQPSSIRSTQLRRLRSSRRRRSVHLRHSVGSSSTVRSIFFKNGWTGGNQEDYAGRRYASKKRTENEFMTVGNLQCSSIFEVVLHWEVQSQKVDR